MSAQAHLAIDGERLALYVHRTTIGAVYGMAGRTLVQRSARLVIIATLFLLAQPLVGTAAATHLRCGSVITTDTTLTHNITGCTRTALYIGESNVILDLGGFVIQGLASETTDQIRGIDTQEHSGIVLKNGTVKGFDIGVWVTGPDPLRTGGSNNKIKRLVAKANGTNIHLDGATNTLVSGSNLVSGGHGIKMINGDNNSILNSKISDNRGHGVSVDEAGTSLISGNTITNNAANGVEAVTTATVRDNKISHNGGSGIEQLAHAQTGPNVAPLTISGNLICDNGYHGIITVYEGHTITDNDVGAGTTGCLPNARILGHDLHDDEADHFQPEDLFSECRSTWRNNYTEGDTFNHPCVTR